MASHGGTAVGRVTMAAALAMVAQFAMFLPPSVLVVLLLFACDLVSFKINDNDMHSIICLTITALLHNYRETFSSRRPSFFVSFVCLLAYLVSACYSILARSAL